jgi:small-conductance mechanosensitive channel
LSAQPAASISAKAGGPQQTAVGQAPPASAPQPAPGNGAQPAPAQGASAANTSSSAHAAQAHAAPDLTLEQQIARLPPLNGINIDVKAQSQAILQHLTEVLRFYRAATTKIQKAGEPSDILYAEQSKAQATQIAQLAFQSARNEAVLLTRVNVPANGTPEVQDTTGTQPESQRLAAARARILSQIAALQAVDVANDAAIAHSNAKTRPPLLQRQEQIDGEFKLLQATLDALNRVAKFTDTQGGRTGLIGDIERLANSAPELNAGTGKSITAPPLENLAAMEHAGIVTQGSVLFDLLSVRRSIDEQIAETDRLRNQAHNLRDPFTNVLSRLFKQGQTLSQQTVDLKATPTNDTQDILATRKQFDELASTFRVLSDAMLPLSQEVLLLEQERGTLSSWRIAVQEEYKAILRSLLIRVALIAVALLLLAVVGQIWNRATVRYVADLRRRRQLLLVRRVVVGFLGGLIVIFGFITQFSSLATFAGFLTAGIAVGLQTILLSVAAYFFIIGRYGVRVGDRITVAGVTGTVIEVGIARFYMMELVGSGTELHSTGRVAVFANSVLFQTGTPLYKQLPGTEYAWHELTAKLKPDADTEAVSNALCSIIEGVYQTYKSAIEAQQHQIESWIGAAVDPPRVDSRLRMVDDSLQIAILFPVQIDGAARADAAIASQILKAMQTEGPLKQGLVGVPAIKAAIQT